MKIYLQAPMKGVKDSNRPLFEFWASVFRACGHVVISPPELAQQLNAHFGQERGDIKPERRDFLLYDLEFLSNCEAMVNIGPITYKSSGCKVEVAFCDAVDIPYFNSPLAFLEHTREKGLMKTILAA